MTFQEKLDKAKKVKQILDDEVIRQTWLDLEQKYVDEWIKTSPDDIEKREMLYLSIQVLQHVQDHFQAILNDGDIVVNYNKKLKR
tara:strand:+ start:98 stop:352 length:255 start_codon:yes stop_codon:yes gene_type:complete